MLFLVACANKQAEPQIDQTSVNQEENLTQGQEKNQEVSPKGAKSKALPKKTSSDKDSVSEEKETVSEIKEVEPIYSYELIIEDMSLNYKKSEDKEDKKDEKDFEADRLSMEQKIKDLFRENSQLESLKKIPFQNELTLERRVESDIQTAIKVMESYGFYSSEASFEIVDLHNSEENNLTSTNQEGEVKVTNVDTEEQAREKKEKAKEEEEKENESSELRYKVTLYLKPHQQYFIEEIKIKYTQYLGIPKAFTVRKERVGLFSKKVVPSYTFEFPSDLKGIERGDSADADTILAATDAFIYPFQDNGYPEARISNMAFSVNKEEESLKGTVFVSQNMPVLMGDAVISGNEKVSEKFIQDLKPWKTGTFWDERSILDYRDALHKAGLFKKIEIDYDKEAYNDYREKVVAYRKKLIQLRKTAKAEGRSTKEADIIKEAEEKKIFFPTPPTMPINVQLEESTARTLSGSVSYSTDDGFGLKGSWEHRNFFGNGERLRIEVPLTKDEALLDAELKKSAFLHPEQSLIFQASGGYENTDAYERNYVDLAFGIERELYKKWLVKSLLHFDFVQPKDSPDELSYHAMRLENSVRYDNRDDSQIPTKGYLAEIKFSPLWGYDNESFYGLPVEFIGTGYLSVTDSTVLVGRLGVGIMPGSGEERIPRSERFFLGGNNTVRGFSYQELGKHDSDGDPIGGLSYNFINLELRYSIDEDLTIVPFVDAGMVYESNTPRWGENLAVGVGIGARYATPVGPIRLDLAFPINNPYHKEHKNWDDFQLYVSIGQSF